MATKKKTTGASQPEVKGLSDTKRWIYGFALLFFALFVGVAVVSYFIYWRDDQNVALWSRVLAAGEQPVMNWGGQARRGACPTTSWATGSGCSGSAFRSCW